MADERALFRSAVFVMLLNEDNKVWLQRRMDTGYMDGHLDFLSGHIDPGESPLEAAVREVLEESTVVINPNSLRLVHVNLNMYDVPYINFTYATHDWQGVPQIGEPHKCSEAGFYSLDELNDNVTLNVQLLRNAYKPGDVTHSKVTRENLDDIMAAGAA